MQVAVVGALGQLGTEVCNAFDGDEVIALDQDTIDIADESSVRGRLLDEFNPRVVVNVAAYHNLKMCEEHPDVAFAVNALGVKHLADACREASARLVHVSTDYVFGHGGTTPYTERNLPAPLSTYAISKVAGEHYALALCEEACVVRSAALYGHAPCRAKGGRNFVQLMLHLAETQPEVRVVTDEVTTPTYCVPLAQQIALIARKGKPGIYHATCQGECSWYDFATAIYEEAEMDVNLQPARSAEFQSELRRPNYSVLDNACLREQDLDIMPHWRDALREYVHILKQESLT